MDMLTNHVKTQSKNYYHMVTNRKIELRKVNINGKSKNSKNNKSKT